MCVCVCVFAHTLHCSLLSSNLDRRYPKQSIRYIRQGLMSVGHRVFCSPPAKRPPSPTLFLSMDYARASHTRPIRSEAEPLFVQSKAFILSAPRILRKRFIQPNARMFLRYRHRTSRISKGGKWINERQSKGAAGGAEFSKIETAILMRVFEVSVQKLVDLSTNHCALLLKAKV